MIEDADLQQKEYEKQKSRFKRQKLMSRKQDLF